MHAHTRCSSDRMRAKGACDQKKQGERGSEQGRSQRAGQDAASPLLWSVVEQGVKPPFTVRCGQIYSWKLPFSPHLFSSPYIYVWGLLPCSPLPAPEPLADQIAREQETPNWY